MQPVYRRRRKRARTTTTTSEANELVDPPTTTVPRRRPAPCNFDDDSAFVFGGSQEDEPVVSDRACLVHFLEERRTGQWNQRQNVWQSKLLTCLQKVENNDIENNNINSNKSRPKTRITRRWRPFASRSIPFTSLGTPPSDAILALERKGSYVLSLGGNERNVDSNLALALRFYGIPSSAAVLARNRSGSSFSFRRTNTTPLLQTTPLLYDIAVQEEESVEDSIFNFRRIVSPANTPVKILLSNDWKMGVALMLPVRDPSSWNEEGPSGTLALFSLHTTQSDSTSNTLTTFQCANVRIGADASFTPRNLLWRVSGIPIMAPAVDDTTQQDCESTSTTAAKTRMNLPGYLFFNDEEDGFRLTWAVIDTWNDADGCEETLTESPLVGGIDCTQPIITVEKTWEVCHSDRYSGARKYNCSVISNGGVRIGCEAFLHVDTLLNDILSRRKTFSQRHSEYYYNLISVSCGGRVAELVITFITQKPGSLGVFVRVDLFTGRFQEQEWIKSVGTQDVSSLRRWCNAIALNRRMRQIKAGPYCIEGKHSIDWGRLCKETSLDYDEDDNFTPDIWKPYVDSAGSVLTMKPPKFVSLSSLYPDCDLVTNKAVISKLPVSSLKCKNSPIQLVYG